MKQLLRISGWLSLLFFATSVDAQSFQRCTASEKLAIDILKNPHLKDEVHSYETKIQNIETSLSTMKLTTAGVITIPVVVHVVYKTAAQNISDEQIISQIQVLNQDFRRLNPDSINTPSVFLPVAADCKLEFRLAQFNPSGGATNGITRTATVKNNIGSDTAVFYTALGGENIWDPLRYLNLWVCNIDNGSTLGTTTFPANATATQDGSIIDYRVFGSIGTLTPQYNKGRTTTHEIGHYFGLNHLWGDTNCGDDLVSDTPPQQTSNFGCPAFPHVSGCPGSNSAGDLFSNYMDYVDDTCMNIFTQGQKARMLAALSIAPRLSLTSSNAIGIWEVKVKTKLIQIYPNPSPGIVNLALMENKKNTWIEIQNSFGELIYSKLCTDSSTKLEIDLSEKPAGLYFAKASGESTIEVVKFVLTK